MNRKNQTSEQVSYVRCKNCGILPYGEYKKWDGFHYCVHCNGVANKYWEDATPLPCPSWLAVKWEAFTDYIKGIFHNG